LNHVENLLKAGERDIGKLQQQLRERMTETTGVIVDYGVIVDSTTLSELTSVVPEMVALVAARVGTTRLIDNRVLRLD
jgi:pantoate--beta-alanine ligase